MSSSRCQAEDALSTMSAVCLLHHDGTVVSEEHRGPGQRYITVKKCNRKL